MMQNQNLNNNNNVPHHRPMNSYQQYGYCDNNNVMCNCLCTCLQHFPITTHTRSPARPLYHCAPSVPNWAGLDEYVVHITVPPNITIVPQQCAQRPPPLSPYRHRYQAPPRPPLPRPCVNRQLQVVTDSVSPAMANNHPYLISVNPTPLPSGVVPIFVEENAFSIPSEIPCFPPICSPISLCSEDLPPSPKRLCIDIIDEPSNSVQDKCDQKLCDDFEIEPNDDLYIDDDDNETPHDTIDLSKDSPRNGDVFDISSDNQMQGQLPFVQFLSSPKAQQTHFCSSVPDYLSESGNSDHEEHDTPLIVSIPLSFVSPAVSSVESCESSQFVVSIPIEVWEMNKNNCPVQNKTSLVSSRENETSLVSSRENEDQKALKILEKIFEQSNLITAKDADFIRMFLKGDGEKITADSPVMRYALSRVFDGDNLQYASIELDLVNQQWRGVMINATDTNSISFNNEYLVL